MTQATLKQYAQTWARMTNENRHSEVLKVIANFFCVYSQNRRGMSIYSRFVTIFDCIERAHIAERTLPQELYQYRYRKMHDLLNTIQETDGKEARDIVYDCL